MILIGLLICVVAILGLVICVEADLPLLALQCFFTWIVGMATMAWAVFGGL